MAFRSEHIQVDGSINIDGSIFQWGVLFEGGTSDVSLNAVWTKLGNVDTSLLNLGIKDVQQDASIIALRTKDGNIDTSLNGLWTKFGSVDTSLLNLGTKNTNQDTSLNSIWTKLGSVDTSLLNLGIKDVQQDASIVALRTKDGNIDTSLNNIWTKLDACLGGGSDPLKYDKIGGLISGDVSVAGNITSSGLVSAISTANYLIKWKQSVGMPGYTYSSPQGSGISNSSPYTELVYLNATTNSINFYTSGAWAAGIDSAQFSTTGRSWVNILSPSFPNISGSIDHSGNSNGFTIISQTDSAGNKASGAISFFTSVNATAATEKCRITPDGQFSANNGTESLPGIVFQGDQDTGFFLYGTAAIGVCLGGDEKYRFTGGNFHAGGDIISSSTTTPSDKRLKKNIKLIENALESVSKLEGVSFELISNNQKKLGLIAQDVECILPEVVSEHEMLDGSIYKMIDYPSLIPVLINAINEQQKQITELKRIIHGHS